MPSIHTLHPITNENHTRKSQGSYISGVTQVLSAAGTIHEQLTGSLCEGRQELLTGVGITLCFTMKKHGLMLGLCGARARGCLKPAQVNASKFRPPKNA